MRSFRCDQGGPQSCPTSALSSVLHPLDHFERCRRPQHIWSAAGSGHEGTLCHKLGRPLCSEVALNARVLEWRSAVAGVFYDSRQRKERRTRFFYTLALRMWNAKSTGESAATKPQLVTSVTTLLVTSEISLHTVYSVQWPEYSAWHHLGLSGS